MDTQSHALLNQRGSTCACFYQKQLCVSIIQSSIHPTENLICTIITNIIVVVMSRPEFLKFLFTHSKLTPPFTADFFSPFNLLVEYILIILTSVCMILIMVVILALYKYKKKQNQKNKGGQKIAIVQSSSSDASSLRETSHEFQLMFTSPFLDTLGHP